MGIGVCSCVWKGRVACDEHVNVCVKEVGCGERERAREREMCARGGVCSTLW